MFLQQPFAHAREEERCCVDRSKSKSAAATMKGGAGGGARLDRDRGSNFFRKVVFHTTQDTHTQPHLLYQRFSRVVDYNIAHVGSCAQ